MSGVCVVATFDGVASVMADPDDAIADYLAFIEAQPVVARIAGVPLDENGKPNLTRTREVLGYTVVVSIKLGGAAT